VIYARTNSAAADKSLFRYHEMLFMIDTCQANTMYSKFYSPNIIATGSSEIDQSSYSHHADNDVGVAVIDRYTYYNLEFLESHVTPSSKQTVGDLFDSYDEGKIHSSPGVRWDLFEGGINEGRSRLVTDFFGNVQNVEVEDKLSEEQWKEDLIQLGKLMAMRNDTAAAGFAKEMERAQRETEKLVGLAKGVKQNAKKRPGAFKVQAEVGWGKQALGAGALLGCAAVWFVGSHMG
jgi:GPI-anchor transamidase subunit K